MGLLPGQDKCPLDGAADGKTITLRALVMPTAHDTLLRPVGCAERVLLEHPDPAVNGLPAASLKRDRNFRRFTKFVTAHEKSTPTVTCKECWIYKVVADFTGRLDIAPRAGLKFDESTGKAVGMDGFGHPMPFTRYRLVLTSVANVQATKEQSRQR
jgi:hypothetical protein